jgi:hypothetical protein
MGVGKGVGLVVGFELERYLQEPFFWKIGGLPPLLTMTVLLPTLDGCIVTLWVARVRSLHFNLGRLTSLHLTFSTRNRSHVTILSTSLTMLCACKVNFPVFGFLFILVAVCNLVLLL